jgi:hypothetical protein
MKTNILSKNNTGAGCFCNFFNKKALINTYFSLSPITYQPRRDKKFPDSATHHQGITFL